MEIRHLKSEDSKALVPTLVGTNAIIFPADNVEDCFRQVHYLGFELNQLCQGLIAKDRWRVLREFFFQIKGFQVVLSDWANVREKDLLIKPILETRVGDPLPITLLFLHLAMALELPVSLVQARKHFVVKCVIDGQSSYLDISKNGRVLDDTEIFQMLQNAKCNLDLWCARELYRHYLEELIRLFENRQNPQMLHTIYNLFLHLDESNLPVLGRRALLRQRMGFAKEAITDLKRYFSFVDRSHAPIELQKAMQDLEAASEEMICDRPPTLLH